MIIYSSDLFGLKQLQIWHGSAVFRAIFPAMFSTGMLFAYARLWAENDDDDDPDDVTHPYALSVFIVFFSFLLAFRLNYSYQRVRTYSCSVERQLMLPPSFSFLVPFRFSSTGKQPRKCIKCLVNGLIQQFVWRRFIISAINIKTGGPSLLGATQKCAT
jgi:hypothetical protein